MALLSHVNARVKSRPAIKLPLLPLASLYAASADATVRAFALVYAGMAADRAPPGERVASVPHLISGVSTRPRESGATALRLAVDALVAGGSGPTAAAPLAEAGAFLSDAGDARSVLSFVATLLLYQPPGRAPTAPPPPASALQTAAALQVAAGAAVAAPAGPLADERRPPPLTLADGRTLPGGLTPADVAAVEGQAPPPDRTTLVARKGAALSFVSSRAFTAAVSGDAPLAALAPDLAYVYAVASADADDGVARKGEDLLKKALGEGPSSTDVLENSTLVRRLLRLVVGGTPASLDADGGGVPALEAGAPLHADHAAPSPPQLATRALSLLSRSRAAAAAFPAAARAVDVTVFGTAPPTVAAAGAEYLVWILRHAPDDALAPRAPTVLSRLLAAVDAPSEGGAVPTAARATAYQAIAALARRAPACLAAAGPDAARTLFTALASEPAGVRAAAQEAVASAAAAYAGVTGDAAGALADLLLEAAASDDAAVRLCAATWAARLFTRSHLPSRWVCILASGDATLAVREAGEVGLFAGVDDRRGPPLPDAKKTGRAAAAKRTASGDLKDASPPPPPPVDLLAPSPAASSAPPAVDELVRYAEARVPGLMRPPAVGAAAAAGAVGPPLAPGPFRALVRFAAECRSADATPEPPASYLALLDSALGPACPSPLRAAALAALVADAAAGHGSALATRYADSDGAELLRRELGCVDAAARRDAAQLVALAAASGDAPATLTRLTAAASTPTGRFEARDGALSAIGYLLARPAGRADAAVATAALSSLVEAAGSTDAALAATAVAAIGVAALGGPLPGAETDTVDTLATTLTSTREPAVASAAALALGRAAAGNPPAAVRAVTALLALATSKPPPPETVVTSAADGLVWAFGGHGTPVTGPLIGDGRAGSGRSAAMLGATPAAPPAEAAPPPPGTTAARAVLLDALLGTPGGATPALALAPSAPARAAAAAWLASLLTACGGAAELRTRPRLEAAQRALNALLADGGDAAADAAPRGLVAIYALAPDDDTRSSLVDGLSAALSGAGTGAAAASTTAIKADASTKLFDGGALGAAPPSAGGGALTTLGEINALATDAGDPSLVYKFLALAASGRDARAASGAALSLAALASSLGAARGALTCALLPRVWRASHDPAPAVRDAMASILSALTDGDEKAALAAHGDAVLAGLLKDATARAWREREAACRACVGLLASGPPSVRTGASLASVANVALRCADDVKPSVRAAGSSLLRAARGSALKALDPARAAADPAAAADVLAGLLPPLVTEALPTAATEVRGAILDTVAALAAAAPRVALAPLAPVIVPPFLEALSALEDARLNELEQHVSALGLDGSSLESARVAASAASKPAAVLDAALAAVADDPAAVAALAPALGDALKRGVGAASRAGAARFVGVLAARAPDAVRPLARKLLSALLTGAKSGGGAGGAVRGAYATAAAAVARVAPEKDVTDFTSALAALGRDPAAPPAHRELAAVAALALHRGAADAAASAAAAFVPLSFIGRQDDDAGVAAAWTSFWDEAAPGVGAAWRLHGVELAEAVVSGLAAPQHAARAAAAAALADAAAVVASDGLAPHAGALADAVCGALGGAYWDGKESVARAGGALIACVGQVAPDAATRVAAAMVAAAQRPKPGFAGAALAALATAAPKLPPASAADALAVAVDRLAAAADAAPPARTGKDDPPARPPPAADAAAAVAALAAVAPASAVASVGDRAATAVATLLGPSHPWADRVAAAAPAGALAKGAAAAAPSWITATILPALTTATREPKIVAVREKAVDALGMVAGASGEAGAAAAAELARVAASDASDAVKTRATAAAAKAAAEKKG